MINVVIPMAGSGSRFAKAGYSLPKPLIDVLGKPMIHRVLDNLSIEDAKYILLARSEHLDAYGEYFKAIESSYRVEFVSIDKLTDGATCTVLHARKLIDNDNPLLIANSDQIVDIQFDDFISEARRKGLDGSILTFKEPSRDPKWSYARTDNSGFVQEVREKVAISDEATVGVYYFRKGANFIDWSIDMVARNDRVNGEFYVCPVYNYGLSEGAIIGTYLIEKRLMHGIGTPEDLMAYFDFVSK